MMNDLKRRENRDTQRSYVKAKADTGVIQLQAKECQWLLAFLVRERQGGIPFSRREREHGSTDTLALNF
jgi:hypothetical protein